MVIGLSILLVHLPYHRSNITAYFAASLSATFTWVALVVRTHCHHAPKLAHNAFPNFIETGIKPFVTVEHCGTLEGRYCGIVFPSQGSADSKEDASPEK